MSKGCKQRPVNKKLFDLNFENIRWKSKSKLSKTKTNKTNRG